MDSLICLASSCPPDALLTTPEVLRLVGSLFLAILFLQSGLDKVVDRQGNVDWLTGHFANSPLASQVVPMLSVITVIEVSAGVLSAIGAVVMLLGGSTKIAAWGALVALAALLMLFFGQRMAKDYGGAAVLVPYFIAAGLTLWLLGT